MKYTCIMHHLFERYISFLNFQIAKYFWKWVCINIFNLYISKIHGKEIESIFKIQFQICSVLKTGVYRKRYLSHKRWCYTGISGPEKSHNNICEKILYFFKYVDIAYQLLARHSPLAPLGQVDEWATKPSRFSIQVVCQSFLELWWLKHQKIYIDRQRGSNFAWRGKKPIY